MKILVTGGAGFIGSHVVEALVARGDSVTVLDDLSSGLRERVNPAATLVVGDVADEATVHALVEKSEAVIHLAAIASVQECERAPERTARVNIDGTGHVFAAAAQKQIPVVYASSAAVYGDNPNLPLEESFAPAPLGNYGRHKLENEAIAARYADRVASVGVRFFNVYGPRQDPRSPYSGVISIFAARARAGEPLVFFGDGEQTRDFIYVGDAVALLLRALTAGAGTHILNGCTGQATSLKQLAQAVGVAMGKPITTHHQAARTGEIRHSRGNPARAAALLGVTAQTPLAEGLRRLAEYE